VAIRNVRHKAIDEIKALHKATKITEDEQKRAVDHVQKLTDRFIKEIDVSHSGQRKRDPGGIACFIGWSWPSRKCSKACRRVKFLGTLPLSWTAIGVGRVRAPCRLPKGIGAG